MDVLSIASSGLQAAQLEMSAAASNIVNENTPDYQTETVDLVDLATGGVEGTEIDDSDDTPDPDSEIAKLKQASYLYDANAMVVQVASQMYGSLLNVLDTQDQNSDWDDSNS